MSGGDLLFLSFSFTCQRKKNKIQKTCFAQFYLNVIALLIGYIDVESYVVNEGYESESFVLRKTRKGR